MNKFLQALKDLSKGQRAALATSLCAVILCVGVGVGVAIGAPDGFSPTGSQVSAQQTEEAEQASEGNNPDSDGVSSSAEADSDSNDAAGSSGANTSDEQADGSQSGKNNSGSGTSEKNGDNNSNSNAGAASSKATSSSKSSSNSSASSSSSKSSSNASSSSSSKSSSSSGSSKSSASDTSNKIKVSIKVDGSAAKKGGFTKGTQTVTLKQGASVYDALKATGCKVSGSSSYVTAINGLAEKQNGARSGWMYSVNGTVPMQSAGSYKLSNGDSVRWYYVT